jgi:hypothetical protein
MTPEERRLRSQHGAHAGWARVTDRTARTAKARRTFQDSFLEGIDPSLPPKVREQMAESRRRAFYAKLAYQSVRARNARKAARKKAGANDSGAPAKRGRRRKGDPPASQPSEGSGAS